MHYIFSLAQGIILLKNNKYENSCIKFKTVLEKEPTNIYALHGKGQSFFEMGETEDAINSYNEALKIKPDFANALNSKANALDKLDNKKEALEIYQKLNEIKPENAVYKLNYALCLCELENFEESQNVLSEAEKLFESQKNDFDDDIIKKFEKNVKKLKRELNNKKIKTN